MNYSTTGRPRRLTDEQVAELIAWHRSKLTNAQKAAQLGITRTTLEAIVRSGGTHYKQVCPERHRQIREMRGSL